jgi:hypothetical protein
MVIVDIDSDYCPDLCFSYQLCLDEGTDTYYVYMETGVLQGRYLGRGFESFGEAWACLKEAIAVNELLEV